LRSMPSYAVRGSTAHHPTGSRSRYATSPLVACDPGCPQAVCSRRRSMRSSTANERKDSRGRNL
jgi:hypothetical protein